MGRGFGKDDIHSRCNLVLCRFLHRSGMQLVMDVGKSPSTRDPQACRDI